MKMPDLLNRDDAPFESGFWDLIDQTVRSVAESQLSARKLIYSDGPFGLGLQFVPGTEKDTGKVENGMEITAPICMPLPLFNASFSISAREIEAHKRDGLSLSLQQLIKNVLNVCAQEDSFIFYGLKTMGIPGLLNSPGVQKSKLKEWDQVGDAVEAVIAAVEKLDAAGFHCPYSLALSTALYNKLFRRYPQTEILEMDHLKALVTDGIIKASAISSGGVLIASGRAFASIILGQDLSVGFEGPSGRDFIFTLSESLALRLIMPSSVCVLEGAT